MNEWKWLVLCGHFTGDGSSDHCLFRNDDDGDSRFPFFRSQAAAEEYVMLHRLGKDCLIAKVVVEAVGATELRYENGSRITATKPR